MKQQKSNNHIFEIILLAVFFACMVIAIFDFYIFQGFAEGLIGSFRTPVLTRIMMFFTTLGNYYSMVALFLALLILLFGLGRKKSSYLLSVCMAVGLALSTLLKLIVQRARPELSLITEPGYSFPSQHAMMSAIFFLVLLYIFKDGIKNKTSRRLFIFFCIFMFLAIGFSRIYLGVHWMSDVIAGWALGVLLVKFIRYKFFEKEKRRKGKK